MSRRIFYIQFQFQHPQPTTVLSEHSTTGKPSPTSGVARGTPSRVACRFDESKLINEFTDNDLIIYGTCPHLFLLGKGLRGKKGSLNQNVTELLMRFFDSRFERDHRLIFLLFNQLQRHEATRGVSQLGVKNCSKSIKDVIEYVTSATFQAELTEAVVKPDGKASKRIQKILGPHLRVAGGHIPYSPSARAKCLSELYAMVFYFGLPSFFITISPSDLDAVLIIELCKSPLSAGTTAVPGSTTESTSRVPLPGLADRAKLLAENPGHAAAVFHHLMESVSSALYRLDMEAGRRKSNPPVSQRECSILGVPVGYYGVFETQGRGSLHVHTAFWGGLPPELLVKLAHDPVFAQQVSKSFQRTMSRDSSNTGSQIRVFLIMSFDSITGRQYPRYLCVGNHPKGLPRCWKSPKGASGPCTASCSKACLDRLSVANSKRYWYDNGGVQEHRRKHDSRYGDH